MRALTLVATAALALLGISVAQSALAPAAAAEDAPSLHVDPYFVTGTYKGVAVDIKATNVTNATEVRVVMERDGYPDVVKTNQPETGSVLASINSGNAVTAPIVIQPGSYNEAGSSSWVQPTAKWSAETKPTTLTVQIVGADGIIVEKSIPAESIGGPFATLSDVMPVPPAFTTPSATFHNVEGYKGIAVQVDVEGLLDAETLSVQVNRAEGGPVIKQATPRTVALLNVGEATRVTAPIVIQPGSYDEDGSLSWIKPDATWTPETIPTSVTITIERALGPDLVTTLDIVGSSEAVMPKLPTLHVDPYFRDDARMTGIGIDIKATNVTDADEVRVTVHRLVGGDVVKTSNPDGSVLDTINAGTAVTAPIIIRPGGTYSEAASGSWHPATVNAEPAIWTAETVPTGVTVEVLREGVVLVEQTTEAFGPAGGPDLADVMPDAPELANVRATYFDGNYKGIAVDFRTVGFTDAERITLRVDREGASPVIKTTKATSGTLEAANKGGVQAWTAPIVIQPGTYDDKTSSNWFKPVAAWTPTSVPTSVTVTVERTYGSDVVVTVPTINDASVGPADVLPAEAPTAPIVVEIPTDVPTYEVEVPADAEDVKLDLGAVTPTSDGVEVTVPVEVVVSTQVGANVTIAANTKASSSDPAWDGVIELPKVKTGVVVPAGSGQTTTVGVALQMGSSTARIDFDSPVKLVLAGQAGKSAGYIDQSGAFHAIADACGPTPLAGLTDAECWVNDGADLVIWTTHFTTFVSYTSAATPTPGGGGSSGGGTSTPSTGGGSGGSSAGGTSVTPSSQQQGVPAAAAAQTPTKTKAPVATTKAPVTPPAANAPESDTEPEAAQSPSAEGGFDPFWLLVILIPVVIIIGVAVTVTVVRARRA